MYFYTSVLFRQYQTKYCIFHIQNYILFRFSLFFQNKALIFVNAIAVCLYSYFSFLLPAIQLVSTWGKSYEDVCRSPSYVSVITGNILITIARFACYHLLLASNSTFMTDSKYLGTFPIQRNLNKHRYYLTSTKSMVCQKDADF